MGNHTIKIDADLNLAKVQKKVGDLSGMLSGIARKHAIQLFDKNSMDFLQNQAKQSLEFLKKKHEEINGEVEEYQRQLKITTDTYGEHARLTDAINSKLKVQKDLQQDIAKLSEQSNQGNNGFLGSFGGKLRGLPGGGAVSTLTSGMGAGSMLGMGAGALAVAGAWHTISKIREGYGQYSQGLQSRTLMRGRGFGDVRGANQGLSDMGMSPEEIRQHQLASSDIFGRGGSSGEAVYGRARFAKSVGLSLDQVQGAGAGLRASMGMGQGSKAFAELEASILSNKIKDAIGPYLETAASMLTQLNENGMSFDPSALSALGSLVTKRGMSPEMGGRMLTGFDQRIKGSTGELNAFFQDAFAQGGLGGGMVGGTQEVVNQGLFGSDKGKASRYMNSQELGDFESIGSFGGDGFKKRMSGINAKLSSFNFPDTRQGRLSKSHVMQRMYGAKSGLEAVQMHNSLMEASNASPADREGMLKNIKAQFGSNEEKQLKVQGDQLKLLEQIGSAASPMMQTANQALISIDRTILKVAEHFGVSIEQSPEEIQNRMLAKVGLSSDSLHNLSPEQIDTELSKAEEQKKNAYNLKSWTQAHPFPGMGSASTDQQDKYIDLMNHVILLLQEQKAVAKQHLQEAKKHKNVIKPPGGKH